LDSDKKTKLAADQPGASTEKEKASAPVRKTMGDGYVPRIDYALRARGGQDPIAAALQASQELDQELDAEEHSGKVDAGPGDGCTVCGRHNAPGAKFCAGCGVPQSEGRERQAAGQHHYHHHYHHHYVAPESGTAVPQHDRPVSAAPTSESGRVRVPITGTALSKHEVAVRQLAQDWAQACNTKHLDDLLELYIADALVLRPNVPPVRGMAAIRELFFSVLDAGLGEVEMDTVRVEIFGDVAYEAGRYKMLVPTAMGKRREERGKYLIVAVRQSGEWKIASDCWSSDLSLDADAARTPRKN